MTKQDEIVKAVLAEVYRAEQLHPYWPNDVVHAAAIVSEESGELIRASLRMQFEDGNIEEMRTEAIQTAATCIRLLKNL